MYEFVICCLAVWRLSHLFHAEDGPFDLIVGLRHAAGQGFFGKLMDCFYCLSFWIAIPFTLYLTREPVPFAVSLLALSGAACLLERLTNPSLDASKNVVYYEEDPS